MLEYIRNQFILYKNRPEINLPLGWKRFNIRNFQLLVAPELTIYKVKNEYVTYYLIGVAFHVRYPEINEQDILNRFPINYDEFLDEIDYLCGNHIIIRETTDAVILMNDNAAAMKAFYLLNETGSAEAVASDPATLKLFYELKIDRSKEALEFYNSDFFKKNKIRLGDKTQFKNVYQVLPNHYLNISESKIYRFFPRSPKQELSIEESISNVQFYTQNVIKAASRKYNLKCGLTAGWDSRLVLASTKNEQKEVSYYTFRGSRQKKQQKDIEIATRISENLGLTYEVIDASNPPTDIEIKKISENYSIIPLSKFKIVCNGFESFDKEKDIALLGVISEIAKNYYESVNVKDGDSLARAAHFERFQYVVEHQQKKFDELKPICDKYGYDLRDIAHWEQDITNFAAQGIQYNSYALRTISPFNSREIIKTLLATPRNLRDKHRHSYYKKYLGVVWPELNSFPINPTLKKRLIVFTKKIGLYGLYKYIAVRIVG